VSSGTSAQRPDSFVEDTCRPGAAKGDGKGTRHSRASSQHESRNRHRVVARLGSHRHRRHSLQLPNVLGRPSKTLVSWAREA
jgi:hypothetical protein